MQLGEMNQGATRAAKGRGIRPASEFVAVALLCLVAVALLQWQPAPFAEFSGYPDEASHYLSGLLVRNYIAAGFPSSPIPYAEKFYIQYPYIGIGHWPPFFTRSRAYGCSSSRLPASRTLPMALITTLIAISTYRMICKEFGLLSALWIAIFLVLLPLVKPSPPWSCWTRCWRR